MNEEQENNQLIIQKNEEYYLSTVVVDSDKEVYGKLKLTDIKEAPIAVVSKEILVARFSEKQIKELEANYVGDRIKKAINLAVFTIGFKVDNLAEVIIMVIQDIFTDFSNMTIAEIELAFRMGSRRKFGDIMGITVATFYDWLLKYNETVKKDAVKQLMQIKEAPTEVSEEQKKLLHDKWLKSYIDIFEQYKKFKKDKAKNEPIMIIDSGNVFYEYCKNNNIDGLSQDERNELYENAKEIMKSKHHVREAKNNIQARDFKVIIDAINSNDIDMPLKNRIISEAKRLAITKIFDKLIDNKVELADLINKIENTENKTNG